MVLILQQPDRPLQHFVVLFLYFEGLLGLLVLFFEGFGVFVEVRIRTFEDGSAS